MKAFRTPDVFHGERGKWRDFKFMYKVWIGAAVFEEVIDWLDLAENSTTELQISEGSENAQRRLVDRRVYASLVLLLRGQPLEIMKAVNGNRGFEAYRRLCREYEV